MWTAKWARSKCTQGCFSAPWHWLDHFSSFDTNGHRQGSSVFFSKSCIQYFGLTSVIIIFCFIFSQQIKKLQNYILKVELGSSSSRSGRSSTIGSSSRMSSSQSSSTSIGRTRHFSDLKVSSYRTLVVFVSNVLCVYIIAIIPF